jgi:hypothetical protein
VKVTEQAQRTAKILPASKTSSKFPFVTKKSCARILALACVALATALPAVLWLPRAGSTARAQDSAGAPSLELNRAARPWEFLAAVGMRAGIFGDEAGTFEAWVYPLKILRNFRLRIHVDGATLPAEALARRVIVRPESSTIVYAGDTFSIRETLFVPVQEPGAIIFLDVDSEEPLNVEAAFERDFQLEWPAALGGVGYGWNYTLHAFSFGEDEHKFAALVGSPTASDHHGEFDTNTRRRTKIRSAWVRPPKGRKRKLS